MSAKKEAQNINTNSNTNNVNVNVNVKRPRKANQKKNEPNWYARTIIGGIIALLLSLAGYYIKNYTETGGRKGSMETIKGSDQIQPN